MNIPHTASTSGNSAVQRAGHGARPAATGQGAPTGLLGFASFLSDAADAADDTLLLGDTDGLPGKHRNRLQATDDAGTALPTPDPLAAAAQHALPLSVRPATTAQAPRNDPGNTLATVSLDSEALRATTATPRQGVTTQTTATAPPPPAASVSTPGANVRELLQRLESATVDPLAQAAPTTPARWDAAPSDGLRLATTGASAPASNVTVANPVTMSLSTPVTVSLSNPAGMTPTTRATVNMEPTQGDASAPPVVWMPTTPETAAMSLSTVSTATHVETSVTPSPTASAAPPDGLRLATTGASAPASNVTVANPVTMSLSTPVTVSLSNPAGMTPTTRATVNMEPTQGDASAPPVVWMPTTPGATSTPVATAVRAPVDTEASAPPSSPAPEAAATPVRRPDEAQAALRAQAAATPAPAAPTAPTAAAPTEPDARAAAPLTTRPATGAARTERLSAAAAESRRGISDPSGSATTASALPATERVQDPSATQTLAAHTSTTEHRHGTEPGPSSLWLDGTMPPSTATADVSASASADTAQAAPLGDFADKLAYISANGLSSADFSLSGLGDDAVNVRISMSGNEATVEFRSDGSETRQVLEQAMGQLETLFKKEGLVLSGVSVGGQDSPQQPVFSGAQSQEQAQAQSQSQSQSPSQARTGTPRRFGPGEGAEAIARTPSRQGTGRLDVFA